MDNTLEFLFIAGIVIIAIIIFIAQTAYAENMICKFLEKKGSKNISIQRQWLDFDRDTLTFKVKYQDRNGNQRVNRCKIHATILLDDEIFWKDPVE